MVDGFIEQNWIISSDVYDKSKIYNYDLPKDTWFVEVSINDTDFWNEYVKESGYYSFSIEGILSQILVKMSDVKNPHKDYKFLDDIDYPPCHDYCKCFIEDDIWEIEVDACDYCVENKELYDATYEFRKKLKFIKEREEISKHIDNLTVEEIKNIFKIK